MSKVLDIPGYYYDPEKKKYFKVQPNSSGPSTSAYSSRDVKRRKFEEASAAAAEKEELRQRDRIKMPKLQPLSGGLLARESNCSAFDSPQVFAEGLVPQGHLSASHFQKSGGIFALNPRRDIGPSIVDIRIAWESQLYICRANTDKYNRSTYRSSVEICHGGEPDETNGTARREWFNGDSFGPSTSLTINESSSQVAMTWLETAQASGIAILPLHMSLDGQDAQPNRPPIVTGPGMSRGGEVEIYSSAAPPQASSILFAFGTTHGIMAVDKARVEGRFISPKPDHTRNQPIDVFALEFLKDNHSILLSGGRNGILNITDLRVQKWGTDADTITHYSSITHIKQLDSHRLIVAGLNSSLSQYDLRFRKVKATASPPRSRSKSGPNSNRTMPIVEYPQYHNTSTIFAGFDVDVEAEVVAAAQEQDSGNTCLPVQLFSLHGGHKLRSRFLDKQVKLGSNDPVVKCVKFVRDNESKMKSLYVMTRDLHRYAWAPEEDSDQPRRMFHSYEDDSDGPVSSGDDN